MRDQHVPLAYIVHLSVHCTDDAPPNGFQRIAEDVPFRMTAGRLLHIARIGFLSVFAKSLANCLRLLASYKNFHFSILQS